MAAFLSEAWCAEMTALLQGSGEFRRAAADVRLTLNQVVRDVPGRGTVRYQLRLDGGEATFLPGDAPAADVTITQDYATAVALSRGELTMQNALMQGRLQLSGDMGKIVRHQAALASLDSLRASIEVRY